MSRFLFLSLLISSVLGLSACGQDEVNRQRLVKGCEAAVKVVLDMPKYERSLLKVQSHKFGESEGYDLVTLSVLTTDKEFGGEEPETFNCQFSVTSSLGGMQWNAALAKLQVDDDVYGVVNGQIQGSMTDHMAITSAVERAMK